MLKKLHPREQFIIVLGVIGLAIILFLYWGIFPLLDRRERSERQVLAREKELREMLAYQQEYQQLQSKLRLTTAQLEKRPGDFSLFSFLDQLAGTAGIKKNVVYMKPSTIGDGEKDLNRSRVEIKFAEITLEQVSRFLQRVETSPNLVEVPRLSIKQLNQEHGFLEAVLQVETLD